MCEAGPHLFVFASDYRCRGKSDTVTGCYLPGRRLSAEKARAAADLSVLQLREGGGPPSSTGRSELAMAVPRLRLGWRRVSVEDGRENGMGHRGKQVGLLAETRCARDRESLIDS